MIQVSNHRTSDFTEPNPSQGTVYISHNQNPGTEYIIEVVSSTGSKYMTFSKTAESEFIQDKIIITNSGIYWIIIKSSEGMSASKIVIR